MNLKLTPERISNKRHDPQQTFSIFFYFTQCNHNILGTPFSKECIEIINVNRNKLTINTLINIDNEIVFFQNTTKDYPYCSIVYPMYNKEIHYFEPNEHKFLTFPIPIFQKMEKSNGKILHGSLHYFEPIHKYQNLSFTDIKILTRKTKFLQIFI